MSTATVWDLAAKRAPIALAICGAISIWIGPSIWLYGELGQVRKDVQANAVSIGKIETRLDSLEGKVDTLAAKVDQLIFHLMGTTQP